MTEINVEMLKESLYKVSKALFCIGEVCVDVSKKHISEADALNKIRGYLNDAHMWSRFQVDQIIENCMEPIVTNTFEENKNDWLNKALNEKPVNIDRFVYFITDVDKLTEHKADRDRISAAIERTKEYLK